MVYSPLGKEMVGGGGSGMTFHSILTHLRTSFDSQSQRILLTGWKESWSRGVCLELQWFPLHFVSQRDAFQSRVPFTLQADFIVTKHSHLNLSLQITSI